MPVFTVPSWCCTQNAAGDLIMHCTWGLVEPPSLLSYLGLARSFVVPRGHLKTHPGIYGVVVRLERVNVALIFGFATKFDRERDSISKQQLQTYADVY